MRNSSDVSWLYDLPVWRSRDLISAADEQAMAKRLRSHEEMVAEK